MEMSSDILAKSALNKERLSDEAGESRFLSSILKHGLDAYVDVEGIVTDSTFTCEPTQVLWKSIVAFFELEETNPTLASIIKYAQALGFNVFEKKSEKDWLSSLFHLPTELQDCRIIGSELRKLQIKRELYSRLESSMNNLLEISTLEPLTKIVASVEQPIEEYLMKLISSDSEGDFLLKNSDVYIENLFANPNTSIGFQTGYPKYDEFAGGALEPETMHVVMARPKVGKALKNGSLVYCPDGAKKIEDMKIGDEVFGPDNNISKITGVYPQGKKEIYEVHFSDKTVIECCEEHLWEVTKYYNNKKSVMNTKDILDSGLKCSLNNKYFIPNISPLNFDAKKVKIDPYFLGLWLGDGCFKNDTYSSIDLELINYIKDNIPNNCQIKHVETRDNGLMVYKVKGINNEVETLGLKNTDSHTKFIPNNYKYNSIEVRLAILNGLMDTDGSVNYKNRKSSPQVMYFTTSNQMAKDVKEIVESLGGNATISQSYKNMNGKIFSCNQVSIKLDANRFNLFRLKRKQDKIARHKRIFRFNRYITNIIPTNKYEEMTCITVSNKNGLFITNNFITTHNSTFALNVAINLAKKGTYSILADLEMSERKWINRFLANITGINIRKFKNANFTEEEKDKIRDAQKIISSYPILYLNVNGKSLEEANFCIKRLLNKKVGKNSAGQFDCLYIYDYLRVNDSADVSDSIREYQALGFQAIKLKNFAKQIKIPVLTFVQESRTGDVSGSDRILWLCDSLSRFSRKTEDEINEDIAAGRKGLNRKITPIETRDSEEVEDGAYINYIFDGAVARITEGPTNVELRNGQATLKATDADKATEF